MWFQPKKHPIWIRGSQVMPQNTQILLVWGKNGIGPYFHKKRHFELWEYFLWINNIKTMWFAPSDILFGCLPHVYWAIWVWTRICPAHVNVCHVAFSMDFRCAGALGRYRSNVQFVTIFFVDHVHTQFVNHKIYCESQTKIKPFRILTGPWPDQTMHGPVWWTHIHLRDCDSQKSLWLTNFLWTLSRQFMIHKFQAILFIDLFYNICNKLSVKILVCGGM